MYTHAGTTRETLVLSEAIVDRQIKQASPRLLGQAPGPLMNAKASMETKWDVRAEQIVVDSRNEKGRCLAVFSENTQTNVLVLERCG